LSGLAHVTGFDAAAARQISTSEDTAENRDDDERNHRREGESSLVSK